MPATRAFPRLLMSSLHAVVHVRGSTFPHVQPGQTHTKALVDTRREHCKQHAALMG
jgi:hypothetical protein